MSGFTCTTDPFIKYWESLKYMLFLSVSFFLLILSLFSFSISLSVFLNFLSVCLSLSLSLSFSLNFLLDLSPRNFFFFQMICPVCKIIFISTNLRERWKYFIQHLRNHKYENFNCACADIDEMNFRSHIEVGIFYVLLDF